MREECANPGPGIMELEVRAPAGGSSGSRSDENADRAPAGGSSGSRSDENADRAPVGGSSGSRSIPCKAFNFGFQARTPGRELRNSGPASGRRRSRFALHPLQSLYLRFPGANPGPEITEKADRAPAGGSYGSRSIPRKAFNFGFRARTPGRELRNSGPASGRRLSRFALHPPQSLFLRFPGANPGPGITE